MTKKKTTKVKITKDDNLGEIVYKYPEVAQVLTDYGLHCVGCALSPFDTVETGAKIHGLEEEDIKEMLAKANEVLKNPN